jgi:hypothetical protein
MTMFVLILAGLQLFTAIQMDMFLVSLDQDGVI